MIARVGDVGDHASHLAGVEVPAAHLDDRAEAAVERAPARGLDHVHRIAEERVALQHARGPSRDGERLVEPMRGRACVVVDDATVGGAPCEPGDAGKRVAIGRARPSHGSALGEPALPMLSPASSARSSSRNVASPSPRTTKSTPSAPVQASVARLGSYPPATRCAPGHQARSRRMSLSAVRRWNVMQDRPMTSGRCSRTSRSTVPRTLPGTSTRSAIATCDGHRCCRPATRGRRSACTCRSWACARTRPASRGAARSSVRLAETAQLSTERGLAYTSQHDAGRPLGWSGCRACRVARSSVPDGHDRGARALTWDHEDQRCVASVWVTAWRRVRRPGVGQRAAPSESWHRRRSIARHWSRATASSCARRTSARRCRSGMDRSHSRPT